MKVRLLTGLLRPWAERCRRPRTITLRAIVVADPDAWTASLRALAPQAQADGIPVTSANGPFTVDGVDFMLAGDGRSWLVQAGSSRLAVVVPETASVELVDQTGGFQPAT